MQNNNRKLIQPIEQTTGTNMINSTNFQGTDRAGAIFDQINIIAETCDILSQLFEHAKDPTFEAEMQKIFKNQTGTNSIKLISHSVSVLQSLVGQIKRMTKSSEATRNKSRRTQHVSISQENISFVSEFITEADEHIKLAEAGLLKLRTNPKDKEVLNQIYRAFYTIKGMSGFLNLIEIGSLAYSTENLLDLARKDELKLEDKTIDIVSESLDMLKNMIAELTESDKTSKAASQQNKSAADALKIKSLVLASSEQE
jgi:HPt (histidine-containing phosphotransfer) domain-containing protein